ncbi:hypothetical protein HZB06_02075 [Candidatus Wolfebacteria bacterium]|nr:hypothetical protein [Candidatus Wolfebacteria bacterium]
MNSRYFYFLLIGVGVVFILIGAFSLPEKVFRGNDNVAGQSSDSSVNQPSSPASPFSNFFQWTGSKESPASVSYQGDKTELPKLKAGKSDDKNFISRSTTFVSDPSDLTPPAAPLPKEAQEMRKRMLEISGDSGGAQTASPKIYFVSYPGQYSVDAPVKIIWGVSGEKSGALIEKTLLYWSKNSVSDPQPAKYQSFSENYQGETPQNFEYLPELEPGNYYFRGFARIEAKDYWSDEIKIAVLAE